MSKHEVVEAYLRGQIGRREFIRRLTVAGVSTAAAVAYAQSLGTASAATSQGKHGLVVSNQDYPVFDTDDDGLSDDEENDLGTDPDSADTDGDGYDDGEEVDGGSDPLDADDYPDSGGGGNGGGGNNSGGGNGGGGGGGSYTLPDTGAGSNEGSSWLAPLAAAGAGVAMIAQRLRKSGTSRS
jgi:hypothetical protein